MAEKNKSNPEQSYRRARTRKYFEGNASKNTDRLTERDIETVNKLTQRLKEPAAIGSGVGAAAAMAADLKGSTDPYLSRNEFKEGFYDQPKPPVSYETLKGTAAKPIANVTDTESFAEGGSVRGQKNIQVKKKQFRGVF